MIATIKDIDQTKRLITIAGDGSDLAKVKNHTLQNLQSKVTAPGFRTGKAPLNVVEKQLGADRVQAEVLEEAVNHLYSETIIDNKLHPLNQPKIQLKKYVPFSEIEFTAEIEIIPSIKLGDYKNLKIKRTPVKVTDKDINAVIENLRLRAAERKETIHPATDGDEVLINFEGTDKYKKPVPGASGKDYPLRLGSRTFIPGFEEKLVGLKAGDEKSFSLTFPQDYGVKSLANQKVTFRVKLSKVQQLILPTSDDKFAKKISPFDSMTALRSDIKSQLVTQKMKESDDKLKDEILEKLVASSQIISPDLLVNEQMAHIEQDFVGNLTSRGLTLKEYLDQQGQSEDDWRRQVLKPQAQRRVSVGLVLSQVAVQEGLNVSEDELNLRINLLKNQHQGDQDKAEFDKPAMRRDVASRILTEKTLEKLVSYV